MTNKQKSGLLPTEHKNGTKTVFHYKKTKGKEETVGYTREEQLTFEEPDGEAPERQVTAKAKSTPFTATEVFTAVEEGRRKVGSFLTTN
eukprot:1926272-Amphidinium_carterae.1